MRLGRGRGKPSALAYREAASMELLTEPTACLRRGSDRHPLWSIPDSTCESLGESGLRSTPGAAPLSQLVWEQL